MRNYYKDEITDDIQTFPHLNTKILEDSDRSHRRNDSIYIYVCKDVVHQLSESGAFLTARIACRGTVYKIRLAIPNRLSLKGGA